MKERSFLETRWGVGAMVATSVASLVFFLGLADVTPPLLGAEGPAVTGLEVAPNTATATVLWVPQWDFYAFVSLAAVVLTLAARSAITRHYPSMLLQTVADHRSRETPSAHVRAAFVGVLTAALFVLALVVVVRWSPSVSVVGRPAGVLPPLLLTGAVAQATLLGLVAGVYSYPLVPETCWKPEHYERYMANQWRFAQVFLTLAVAGVVGVTVPFASQFSAVSRPMSLVFAFGVFVPQLLAVVLAVVWRLHTVEREMRQR